MDIYMVFLILSGLPLLAFLLSLAWVLAARRSRDQTLDEWQVGTLDRRMESSRLIVVLALVWSKPIYGFVQAFFLVFTFGGLDGAPLPPDLAGLSLPVFCGLCALVHCAGGLVQGFLEARAVRAGTLVTPAGFRRIFIQLFLVEFLVVLALTLSFLAILGYVPLRY